MARKNALTEDELSKIILLMLLPSTNGADLVRLLKSEISGLSRNLRGVNITDQQIIECKSSLKAILENQNISKSLIEKNLNSFNRLNYYNIKDTARSQGMNFIDTWALKKNRKKELDKIYGWAIFLLPIILILSMCAVSNISRDENLERVCSNAQATGKSMDHSVDDCVSRLKNHSPTGAKWDDSMKIED